MSSEASNYRTIKIVEGDNAYLELISPDGRILKPDGTYKIADRDLVDPVPRMHMYRYYGEDAPILVVFYKTEFDDFKEDKRYLEHYTNMSVDQFSEMAYWLNGC